jgi:DAK2 domain fusion protein YloV
MKDEVRALAKKNALEKLAPYIIEVARVIEIRQKEVNDLNVFPVPDGDTGTNMAATWAGVAFEVGKLPKEAEIADIWEAIEYGAVYHARGNSGVILSQIIKGAVSVLKNARRFDAQTLEKALVEADIQARNSVSEPKEGTILTVIAAMAKAAGEARKQRRNVRAAMGLIAEAATVAVKATPEMLDKLLGRIDAGGYGLSIMFWAAYDLLTGKSSVEDFSTQFDTTMVVSREVGANLDAVWTEGTPIYDVQGAFSPSEGAEFSEGGLADFLRGVGDSELITAARDIVRIHVHTNTPEIVIAEMRRLGEVYEFAVENMRIQAEGYWAGQREKKPIGVVAVAAGSGFAWILRELGVDEIVEGGQTANPEVGEIKAAISKVCAESVIILPGNSNIVLAANAAAGDGCYVVPTRSLPESIAAMTAFEPTKAAMENVADMNMAFSAVKSGAVTKAIRDSATVSGEAVRAGDFIGVAGSEVVAVHSDLAQAVRNLVAKLADGGEIEQITLYAGEDLGDGALHKIGEMLRNEYADCEVGEYRGEQPIYDVILGVE